ncbi:hypothetical protein JCM10207_007457 [Rhodosporidiobolus poonsookiae]
MSADSHLQYRGYATTSDDWTKFEVIDFEPTEFRDDFIEIEIKYCAICSSDVHTISGGWGKVDKPLVSGHEIAGIVRRVGPKVTEFKPGDRALVGAQLDSCGKCKPCNDNNENYCPEQIDTYNAPEKDGKLTQGGYSTAIRAPEKFVFHVPEALELVDAAPMACGGLTVWSPLYRYGIKPGMKVGVIGVGGLGHFAIMFAAAMGAEVIAFSHQEDKLVDAKKMGAADAVLTTKEKWNEPYALKFDFILSTIDNASAMPLTDLVSMLYVNGRLHIAAMPDDELPAFQSQALAGNGATIGVNHIGNKVEAEAMLKFAAEKGIKPWKEVIPMSEVAKGVQGVKNNTVRYRYVMEQDLA